VQFAPEGHSVRRPVRLAGFNSDEHRHTRGSPLFRERALKVAAFPHQTNVEGFLLRLWRPSARLGYIVVEKSCGPGPTNFQAAAGCKTTKKPLHFCTRAFSCHMSEGLVACLDKIIRFYFRRCRIARTSYVL